MPTAVVITSIHGSTPALRFFAAREDLQTIVVGDRKSVPVASSANLRFLSLEDQARLDREFARHCPENHYCRKNVGYVEAIRQGANTIYDTDDDNVPLPNWLVPDFSSQLACATDELFTNAYSLFTSQPVWPRGYPLSEVRKRPTLATRRVDPVAIGVWQGLVAGDPDVDAVFRLTANDQPVQFQERGPLHFPPTTYCPFNSQNTFWARPAFPFLYLPCTVSFRYTDIMRGYVAQRLLREYGLHLGFTPTTVHQDRNDHSLLRDFEEEVPMYLSVEKLVDCLERTDTTGDPFDDLYRCYAALAEEKLVASAELAHLRRWQADLKSGDLGGSGALAG